MPRPVEAMTDHDRSGAHDHDATDEVLESLNPGPPDADTTSVNDGIGARPRLNWNSVTDSGGDAPPRRPDDKGGFAFNLGNALSKLGLDPDVPVADRATLSGALAPLARREPAPAAPVEPEVSAELPLRQRSPERTIERTPDPVADAPLLQRRDTAATVPPAVVDEPLPRRSGSGPASAPIEPPAMHAPVEPAPAPLPARAPVQPMVEPAPAAVEPDAAPVSRSYVAQRGSVFDDVVSPSPQLPPTVVSPPANPAARHAPVSVVPPSNQVIQTPSAPVAAAPSAAPAAPTPAPVLPGAGAPLLPTLPTAVSAPSPIVAPPLDPLGSSQADIRAFRSAQIRATRQQRTGKVVGRTILVLLLIGGLIGVALMFGRDYLFPTNWDPALTPIVDEIELGRGAPFDHTVGLVRQTEADFELTVARLTTGDEWGTRVPEWRALGLATGDPTPATVSVASLDGRNAVYDASGDRIYMPDSVTPDEAATDLRLALERAYDAQFGVSTIAEPTPGSLAGVSATPTIARRAVDRFLVDPTPVTVAGWQAGEGVPAPIAYELLASDALGGPLLDAAGVDREVATFGTDLSTALAAVLDDAPRPAEAGALQVGEKSLADPVALGNDDWSLAWGMRLAPEAVDQLVAVVRADAYRPIDRNGLTCVVGVFETATAPEADVVLVHLTGWVGASPIESQATATRLSETRVQLVTCDPGPTAAPAPGSAAVVALVERQIARLGGG